jgi:3-hydroxyacyl-CoA dehydrogenase
VLMLDILPRDMTEEELKATKNRNKIAQTALDTALKSKPSPIYNKKFANRIQIGNLEDDLKRIGDYDWVIEVVIERLDIKQQLFEKVEQFRKKGTLITSNTSGIPIHMMCEGRSDDFKQNFCGTHFFNPPRYMRLLEVIPTAHTSTDVIAFFMQYGDKYLGKRTVLCKDTPAFIANRVGVYAMAKIYQLTEQLDLKIEDVDVLTGPTIGRPKTGTFRLGDLVGHDTAVNVIKGIKDNCPNDEQATSFEIPKYLQFLIDNKFLGNKTGKGFYERTKQKDDKGRSINLALNLKTLEYAPSEKSNLPSLAISKQIESTPKRIQAVFDLEDNGGKLVRSSLSGLFAYVSNRIPEICDNIYGIDDALTAGFAWEYGPFQYWDIIGIPKGIAAAEAEGHKVATWVHDMVKAGFQTFYKSEAGQKMYYDIPSKGYKPLSHTSDIVILENYYQDKPVFENTEVAVFDIGNGVLCLEFRSKANSIGEGVLKGINETIDIAEKDGWKGLVIGNNATNFTVGANIMMIAMLAYQQEWDELNFAVNYFQQTSMRLRYSKIPVVIATQGYVFGGGCEFSMHADGVVAAAESYIGLVEAGVGLLPGGGGTKEFAVRLSDSFFEGDVQIPTLIEKFKSIATAQVATSAYEAFDLGYLTNTKDVVVVNKDRNIVEAKKKVFSLAENYVPKQPRKDIWVLGRGGLSALLVAAHSLELGHYATEHDIVIAKKIANVLCGGDLTGPQYVSEQYLLDIEREAFLSLCGQQKTLERIQYMLTNNKPLRN